MSLLTPKRILKFLSISIRVVFNLAGSGGALIGTPKSSSAAVRLFHKEESQDLQEREGGEDQGTENIFIARIFSHQLSFTY